MARLHKKNERATELKDIRGEIAWAPSGLPTLDSIVASVFVMSLANGIAVRFTEYQRHDPAVAVWMRRWFEHRRDRYQRENPRELGEPTAMISLVVERAEPGGEYALAEARVASYPAVPEDWPEAPYGELLSRAVAFFRTTGDIGNAP